MIVANPLLLFAVVFAGVFIVGAILYKAFTDPEGRRAKRLKKVHQRNITESQSKAVQRRLSVLEDTGKVTKLDAVYAALGANPKTFKQKLRHADLTITVPEFLLLQLGAMAGLAFIITLLILTNPYFGIPVGCLLGFILPHVYVNYKVEKRIKTFNKIFPDALDIMVRGLRTGLPISECIKSVARDAPNPVGEEFVRMRDDIRLGLSLNEAVWKTSERMNTQEYNFFAIAISVQSDTGGNLAESLENLSGVLRARQQIYRMITAKSSEARWTARVLGALPFFMAFVIHLTDEEYLIPLYTDNRGIALAVLGTIWIFVGVMWLRSMARFDF